MKVLTDKQKLELMIQKGPLLQWLKQQPNKRFEYKHGHVCCLARYLEAQGFADPWVGVHSVTVEIYRSYCPIPPDVAAALCSETYGEVIAKLEASA